MNTKVLVVEDDFANQQVATLFLKKFGYDSEVAENGAIAVELAQLNKYPLILMDCQMPVMNGFDATKTIRNNPGPNQTTAIVALTANLVSGINKEIQKCGMDDILNKPVKMQEMQDMTKLWFGKTSTNLRG